MEHKALAIIPARGGSKRLPRKNVLDLGGKPLIAYTIEAAVKSGCFQTVILSSDDDEILEIGARYGATAEKREERLAGDKTKAIELMQYFADRSDLASQHNIITMLLPTCPFRRASDVRGGFELLTPEVDTVISITDYDFSPTLSVNVVDDSKLLELSEGLTSGNTRTQDLKPAYHPNGAFYISWWPSFKTNASFFKGKVRGYWMSRLYSTDIDEAIDLQYAQFLIDSGTIKLEE